MRKLTDCWDVRFRICSFPLRLLVENFRNLSFVSLYELVFDFSKVKKSISDKKGKFTFELLKSRLCTQGLN